MNNKTDNLAIYNAVRKPPADALRPITSGRLKGKSDINPMWRIQALTEQFGPVGFGWYYETSHWLEPGANGEVAAFCSVRLYVRRGEEWSKPIYGVGGSMLVSKEQKGLHTNDECYKMALTDAIGVACKALGFAADVYWEKGGMYSQEQPVPPPQHQQRAPVASGKGQPRRLICADCGRNIFDIRLDNGRAVAAGELFDRSMKQYGVGLCADCQRLRKGSENA